MPTPEIPLVNERPENPIISESLQQSGVQTVPSTPQFNIQVKNNQPVINNQPATSAKIQLPSDTTGLIKKAKGSVANAATWLAKFFLRLIAKQKITNDANTTNN